MVNLNSTDSLKNSAYCYLSCTVTQKPLRIFFLITYILSQYDQTFIDLVCKALFVKEGECWTLDLVTCELGEPLEDGTTKTRRSAISANLRMVTNVVVKVNPVLLLPRWCGHSTSSSKTVNNRSSLLFQRLGKSGA